MANKRTDTLGDLARFGIALAVRCRRCDHQRLLEPMPLMARHGYGTYWQTLRFRCTSCGSRQVSSAIRPRDLR